MSDNSKPKPQQVQSMQANHKDHYREEYLVQVTIMEAREIRGKDESGTSDPFVRISVGNLPPQVTTTAFGVSSAVWNQSFTFTNLFMNDIEFEKFEILIEVIDMNKFLTNNLIGSYSIGLATLYRSSFHELYNTWLVLSHPEQGLVPQGYVLVSAYIIGTKDSPPVHAINEIVHYDEEPDPYEGIPDEELTAEQLKERKDKNKYPSIIGKPKMLTKGYQLMVNIVKGEDLPLLGISTVCDPFISVRCCGNVLITSVAKNTQKPQYYSKLCFPVEFPVYNDKIVIRIWDKRFMASDIFIANIPEFPKENDFFSLSYLQSRGGLMPFRWFNLYGIPAEERNPSFLDYIFSRNKLIEGTDFFGRVLLSLSLNSNEKPLKGNFSLNAFREPPAINYILRVDAYELQGAKDCGSNIKIKVKIGSYVCDSQLAFCKKDYEQSKIQKKKIYLLDAYEWKENKIMLEEIKCELPQDKTQIPDIIISLYSQSRFSNDYKRVAYTRLPATCSDITINKPKWFPLKSISNNLDPSVHSYILLNVSLRMSVGNQQIPRIPIRRNIKCNFLFSAFLYAGFGIDPESKSDEIETKIEIRIAHYKIELSKCKSGRNPIWNELICKSVEIDENLEFASNIILTVNNPKRKMYNFLNIFSQNVGEICVSALNCQTEDDPRASDFQPDFRYFHIIKNGNSQGRVLAAFYLYKLQKKDEGEDLIRPAIYCQKIPYTISLSILGIRNLPSPVTKCCLKFRIALENIIKLPENLKQPTNKNSEDIIETTVLPTIVTRKIIDNSFLELTVNFNFVNLESNDGSKPEMTSKLGTQNPNFMTLENLDVELPIDPKFYPVIEIEFVSEGYFQSVYQSELTLFECTDFLHTKEKQAIKEFYEIGKKAPEIKKDDEEENLENETNNEKEKRKTLQKEKINNENEKIKNEKEIYSEESDEEDNKLIKDDKFINAKFENFIEILKSPEDKLKEDQERKEKIEKLKKELNEIPADDKYADQIRRTKNAEILYLNSSKMNKKKFEVITDGIQEDYSYGRKVEKTDISQHIRLPYDKIELKELSFLSSSITAYTQGSRKIHQNTKGSVFLKAKIQMKRTGYTKNINDKTSKVSSKRSKQSKKHNDEYKEDEKFPFNIFDRIFLDYLNKSSTLKCRVYIYRCLNLSAQSNYIEAAHYLAGLEGKCSANAYPEILVGSGKTDSNELVKCVTDSNRSINQDLNPKFFRMYELDPQLPNDCNLEIRIWDKQLIKDSLIGFVNIDIEDRLYGQPELKQRIAYQIYKKDFEKKLEGLKYTYDEQKKDEKIILQQKFNEVTSRIEQFNKKINICVEYCAIKNTDKNTSQGTVELFVEPFPLDVAKIVPASSIDPPQPLEFEIRVVIWETFNVAKIRNTVDIFVRVTQESYGWTADGIKKETDTHLGSEDGYGIFNWRMTFPLQIPCPFPRLRFSVYDMETLSADESLGERVISFMKILKKLRTEGKYEMQPRRLKIYHPNFPEEVRGEILYSLNIISKQEADANPVGDGQSEPNHDPFLEPPKLGRGIGDFFKGTLFDFSLWRFCGMRALKILLASIFSLVVTLILFVKPGILVK